MTFGAGAWRELFDVAPACLLVIDGEQLVVEASAQLLDALGRTRDELVGSQLASHLHQSDPGGARWDASTRCLAHAEGSERWFEIGSRESDAFTYLLLTPTRRRAVSGTLSNPVGVERQLEEILRHAPIVLFAVDREGIFTMSRGRGLVALGLAADAVVGQSFFDLYDSEPLASDSMRRALAGETVAVHRDSAGRHFEVHYAPLIGRGAIGVAIDVTAHHRAEERFRRLIERMPDGVAVVREGKVVYANPTLVRELGCDSANDLQGRALRDLLSDADTTTLARVHSAALAADRSPPEEGLFRMRSGSTLAAEVALMPLGDPEAPSTLLVARNVSERKAMQARLVLAERLVSLGTLAAGVAHEVNNPLTYVSLNLGFMARELSGLAKELDAPKDEESSANAEKRQLDLRARVERITEALRVTKEGAERVATIVRDLRAFSHAADDARGPLDVRRVLDSAVSIAWNEIRHRARFVKEYGEVPQVEANEARLAQVFVHLLLNATHALPEGDASRHEIRVAVATDENQRAIIEVRDTGAGIPKDIIDRIFDPFFTTKPVGGGTGLGLSVCHGIVTSLGGEITVQSSAGGSTFRVALPAYVAAPSEREDRRSLIPSPRSPRPRVMVIDDEQLVADALRQALASEADVVVSESGRDAIDILLRDQRFDLILCDLMMPDIAGMDVYEAVRRARPGVEKNFVFMTGGAFTQRARDFVAAVPNRCVDKPVGPDELKRLARETRGKK